MKLSYQRSFILVTTLMALAIICKFTSYEVKADTTPIKDQPSTVVLSANLTSDKVIKVPQKAVEKSTTKTTSTVKKTTLSRGGSGLAQAEPKVASGSNNVAAYAAKFLGYPYVSGGSSTSGFDCSGFTLFVYKAFGVSLPRTARSQYGSGQAVSKGDLAPGDLVFFDTYSTLSHVGVYIGGGKFVHAANPRKGVITNSLSESYYASRFVGARRVLK